MICLFLLFFIKTLGAVDKDISPFKVIYPTSKKGYFGGEYTTHWFKGYCNEMHKTGGKWPTKYFELFFLSGYFRMLYFNDVNYIASYKSSSKISQKESIEQALYELAPSIPTDLIRLGASYQRLKVIEEIGEGASIPQKIVENKLNYDLLKKLIPPFLFGLEGVQFVILNWIKAIHEKTPESLLWEALEKDMIIPALFREEIPIKTQVDEIIREVYDLPGVESYVPILLKKARDTLSLEELPFKIKEQHLSLVHLGFFENSQQK